MKNVEEISTTMDLPMLYQSSSHQYTNPAIKKLAILAHKGPNRANAKRGFLCMYSMLPTICRLVKLRLQLGRLHGQGRSTFEVLKES